MKKFIAILASLMLLISGCGDSGSDSNNSKDSGKKKEKEVVQLNDAEELPYYLYYEERGDKVAFSRLDSLEISDVTPELSFEFQNLKTRKLPASVLNSLEEDYVVVTMTFNGQYFEDDKLHSLQKTRNRFVDEIKYVKGNEVLEIEEISSLTHWKDSWISKEMDDMVVYTEITSIRLFEREAVENENIQIRLPEGDKWTYFNIER